MGDHDSGDPEVFNGLVDLHFRDDVQMTRGFIEKEEFRLLVECSGQ
jgi:hypothetical protein